jgi:signal transduction histidine kinase
VKLSSTARLRLATIAITTLLTAGIGVFAASQTYSDDRAELSSDINQTIQAALENPGQELSASLFYLDQYSLDLSLLLLSRDGEVTTINESTRFLFEELSLSEVEAATSVAQSGEEGEHFLFRSLEISGGDYLVVAGSTESADSKLLSNLYSVAIATIAANTLAFIILTIYIRRLKRRDDDDALTRMQEFLGDASHELRTPLTVVKGYVEMLSKGQITDSETQARAFARVNSEIVRMEGLIHDLLLLAELGESAARESELIDLSTKLRGYGEDFQLLHPSRKVALEIVDGLEMQAVGEYISRFIQNALNNISRHTPESAPVKITLKKNLKAITLTIEDGGPGLPESAYREKVRSLNRFDQSRSRENGGSGLGMSIMAAVIAKLGGEFTLQKSDLGGLAVIATFQRS